MTEHPTTPVMRPAPLRRRRFLVVALGGAVVIAAAVAGWLWYDSVESDRILKSAIAEVEAVDPQWQFESLEARRAVVPDEENSALMIRRAAIRLGPRNPSFAQRRVELLQGLRSPMRLSDAQYSELIADLEEVEAAIEPALAVARHPHGRHPITYSADGVSTLLPHVDDIGQLLWRVLEPLALIQGHEGDAASLVTTWRAMLNLARSVGDEPILVSQTCRTRFSRVAVRGLERMLSQVELPKADLARMQTELAAEAEHDPWAIAMRGERAMLVQALEAVQTGRLKQGVLQGMVFTGPAVPRSSLTQMREWIGDRLGTDTRRDQAWVLRYFSRQQDLASRPWPERYSAVVGLESESDTGPEFTRPQAGVPETAARIFQTAQAHCRCGMAAIATERFRMRRGRWPMSLGELVTTRLLSAVPIDPFDGEALRFRRLPDGIVIYAVGQDMSDGGGDIQTVSPPNREPNDIGVRLWDPAHRRQPPPAGPP